ncbi:MAG: helix-turn-helix transcriptional regulator [Thermoplasmata archaeon]|nr:helix-turn-helix transcriptional regulator [Thermoplasmata archaeon]
MARPARSDAPFPAPGPPAVPIKSCPIAASLGTLGRKWTLTILRDIAFFPDASFSLILRNNPGLLQRTLSLRLKQLSANGLIVKSADSNGARHPRYRLSERGLQIWPILATLAQFGFQNRAEAVFVDGQPRNLEEVFPSDVGILLGRFAGVTAQRARTRPVST